ncbi:hypothetical protein Tco_0224080 [Tanacetum coccineum]
MFMTIQSNVKDKLLATSSETSKVENARAEMLRDLDQQMEKRVDDGKVNVVTDALSRKERVKPRRVPAMAMTILYGWMDKSGSMIQTLEDIMRACVIDFGGSYQLSIRCASFEALYGRKCRSPVLWAEIGESSLIGPELVPETIDKVVLIKEKLKAVRDRQKSYADNRRKPLEFKVGDQVMLKVSPWEKGERDHLIVVDRDMFVMFERERLDVVGFDSSAAFEHRFEKMLLLTWHDSSKPTKEPVIYHHIYTLTQLSGIQGVDIQDHVLPIIQSQFSDINLSFVSQQAATSQVIQDVMRQLSFEETPPNHPWLTPTTIFSDVVGSGVKSYGLSHDESFGLDELYLNLNEPVDLNVSKTETQSELPVSEEPNVGTTQEPIMAEVRTQEPIVEEVKTQEPLGRGNGQKDELAPSDGHFFYDVKGIDSAYKTQYGIHSNKDAGTDDDDDDDFLADEENEVVEPKVDVHLFSISMDVPFDNIGVTNLVLDDILEGEDVDVINADGFDSNNGNDNKTSNYKRRRLAELSREMKGVINVSGQWKSHFTLGRNLLLQKRLRTMSTCIPLKAEEI